MEEILEKMNYQPARLLDDGLENPLRAMSCFFNDLPLHEVRAKLWELYKGWAHHTADYVDTDDAREMLQTYQQLVDFFNTSYVLVERGKLED